MKKYYLIKMIITPLYCNPIVSNIVISESPSTLLLRNLKHREDSSCNVVLDWSSDINEIMYNKLKKYNPTNEGYFKLSKYDYGKSK